ncbi:DnaD domain protein [Aerococcus urinaeequi]|uniref:DnaD domain protein n=1 Tax=Aerococcus urinaeequi TaxID=51665 RepID=A0AAE9XT31_9LACT|nr:DnaD domain protein [Aerococcus urinaeequi]WCG38394.1 DnaD domain protein [Aerococcus urinaeequi]
MAKRVVSTVFWEDEKVVDMFSPEDKYFMLYLLTNPRTTSIGIYALPVKIAAFDLGYSIDSVKVLLERFENKYKMIVYSKEQQEVAVLNTLRYSISKGGKPIEDMVLREIEKVKNISSLEMTHSRMIEWWSISGRDIDFKIKEIFEKEIFKRKEAKENNTNNKANTNTNTNTDTVDVSCNDSLTDTFENSVAPSEEQVGVIGAIDFYQQNFGVLNPYTSQQIVDAIDTFNDDIVIKAMQIALDNNARNYNYVRAILKKWYENNATTIEDIDALELEHKNKVAKKSYKKPQKESVAPKWLNQETRQEKYQGKEAAIEPKQVSEDEIAALEKLKSSVLGGE